MQKLTKQEIILLKWCINCAWNYSNISKEDIEKTKSIIKKLQTKYD